MVLPDICIFTISGVTNAEMARLPFGGAGYHIGALVRGVNLVENRLNEERLIFVQEEVVKPMAITVCGKQRVFESERKATNEVIAADATKSESSHGSSGNNHRQLRLQDDVHRKCSQLP